MEAQTFELKTPYLKTGRSHNILAQTDLINVTIKYSYEEFTIAVSGVRLRSRVIAAPLRH
jgi:hypothetical protein